jgi:hypothetical protein
LINKASSNPPTIIGDVGDVEGLTSILGCRVASLPMKYLGFLRELLTRLLPFGMALLTSLSSTPTPLQNIKNESQVTKLFTTRLTKDQHIIYKQQM